MCRADVHPDAETALAAILGTMAGRLAGRAGVPREDVTIGPVDVGPERETHGDREVGRMNLDERTGAAAAR